MVSVLLAPPSGDSATCSHGFQVRAKLLINHPPSPPSPPVTDLAWFPSRKKICHAQLTQWLKLEHQKRNPVSPETNMACIDKLPWTVLLTRYVLPLEKLKVLFLSFMPFLFLNDRRMWPTLPPCWQTLQYHLLSLVPCNYRRDHPLAWEEETEIKQEWKAEI